MRDWIFTLGLGLAVHLCAAQETVVQVADINPGAPGAYPSYLTVFNNHLYFRANTGLQDTELWRFDGTNTSRVDDIYPGPGGSSPSYLAVLNGQLYFDASSPTTGYKLRRFDGTNVTLVNSQPSSFSGSGDWAPVTWMDQLLFRSNGRIYRWNGSTMAALINPPYANSEPVIFNGAVFYSAQENTFGTELWRYTGSAPTRITDINPNAGDAYPSSLYVHQNALYFAARDNGFGSELWRFNGSSVERVADIYPGPGDSSPSDLVTFRGALYFQADDGVHGRELWKFDGTNVTLAADINPHPVYEQNGDRLSDSAPSRLTVWNDALYFIASSGQATGLWRFDGTNAVILGGGSPNGLTEIITFQDQLYFDADDGIHGRELWRVKVQPEPRMAITQSTGVFDIELKETETGSYVLESSTNFFHWTPLSTNQPVNGRISFPQPAQHSSGSFMYRTVKAP